MEPHAVPSDPDTRCSKRHVHTAHPARLASAGRDVLFEGKSGRALCLNGIDQQGVERVRALGGAQLLDQAAVAQQA